MEPEVSNLESLSADILHILQTTPGKVFKEYELLKLLREKHALADISANNLQLFRQHFVLFHCLYRLQQSLWESQQANLSISALEIKLLPYISGTSSQLQIPDPLRTYYLDLSQLDCMQEQDVNALIGSFWERLARRDHRKEALAILELADPVSDSDIKQRYRELVMTHRPDRGGDKLQLQLLNAALADLLPKNP